MGIEFNPNLNKVTSKSIDNVARSQNTKETGAIIKGGADFANSGITVEANAYIKNLMEHFASVSDKPEFNTKQENLVIRGALMNCADEELAEV